MTGEGGGGGSHSSRVYWIATARKSCRGARSIGFFGIVCIHTRSTYLWNGAAGMGSSRIVAVHRAVRTVPLPPPDRGAAVAKAKLLSSRIRLRPVTGRGGGGMGKSKELISAISRRYVTRIATRMKSLLRLDRFPYNFRLMDESLFDASRFIVPPVVHRST